MADFYPLLTSEPEFRDHHVRFVGGSAAVTRVLGPDQMTITYISTGIVDLTWAAWPGVFAGVSGYCFDATTASALKGFTLVPGTFNATTLKLRLNITNAADTLTDLAALQWLTLNVRFKETALTV